MPKLNIANPLEVGMALKMAAFIAAVALASQVLAQTIGAPGVLVMAALSGMADVDAVTLSMAHLGGHGLTLRVAMEGVLIVTAVNTVTKAAMAAWVGGGRLGLVVGGVSALALGAGALAVGW
ncbi:hypothetical protein AZA_11058 [Nitrospirillum viridazoti Y2]|nr:hypothetical protein AZA_11058 [Nitrospirillum amazonense Y2]